MADSLFGECREATSSSQLRSDPRIHGAVAGADAVLFDFDFTLADSSKGIITCVRYALSEMKLPQPTDDSILRTVGLYLPETLVELTGEQNHRRGDEFLAHFTKKADEVMIEGTFMLAGAGRTLRMLHGAGYPIGVVSTKFKYRIETALEMNKLRDTVQLIVGGEDVTRHKPHPEGLVTASEALGISIDRCVYVGDSEVDARAAEAAGMPFIAVLSGTTSSEIFCRYPAVAVLPSVAEIVSEAF